MRGKRLKSKENILLTLWILMVVFISGCGQGEQNVENAIEEKQEYDLSADSWKGYQEVKESSQVWNVSRYWEDSAPEKEDMELTGIESAVENENYYILYKYLGDGEGESERKYELVSLNLLTQETKESELTFGQEEGDGGEILDFLKGMESGRTDIQGMDVLDGKPGLLAVQYGDTELEHVYVVWLTDSGETDRVLDLLPEIRKTGILQEGTSPSGIRFDRKGYIYLNVDGVAVFDREGILVQNMETAAAATVVESTGRLQDGRPVFEYMAESGKTTIFTFSGEKEQILYEGECGYTGSRYFNKYGEIIFVENGKILRWNAAGGKCESIYSDLGLMPWKCRAVLENGDKISFVFGDGAEMSLIQLGIGDIEETLVTFYQMYEDPEIMLHAAEYSRKHPGIRIEVVSRGQDEDADTALNQLMAQITNGEGPDLLLLKNRQVKPLQENGALAELYGRLPEELTENIFPGILQYGMVGEGLYGIAVSAGVSTMAVSEEFWKEDTWTFQNVMDVMKDREESGSPFSGVCSGQTSDDLLYQLVLKDVAAGTSSLVDMEKKLCCFNGEDFRQVLEFCRKYGVEPGNGKYVSQEERMADIHGGEVLAMFCGGNLAVFSSTMSELGEGYKCVGYPTDEGYGGYVSCSGCVAVNVNTQQGEIADDFLKYLLSEEVQGKIGIGTVRRDVLASHVKEHSNYSEGPVYIAGDGSYVPLAGKTDGSSYLPEYLEVLEKGAPDPTWLEGMGMIVAEESLAYFNGDKTAEEAAKVIQNRVQLFLDTL